MMGGVLGERELRTNTCLRIDLETNAVTQIDSMR